MATPVLTETPQTPQTPQTPATGHAVPLLQLLAGPAAFALALMLPLALSYEGRVSLATFACAIVWWVTRPMPLSPAVRRRQKSSRSHPKGETTPIPVITTRRAWLI